MALMSLEQPLNPKLHSSPCSRDGTGVAMPYAQELVSVLSG
jgi:hypothetical protein